MTMKDDERWLSYGVTGAYLEEKAAWLSEARFLHDRSLRFFELAGTLVSLSRSNYPLASVAFFHAIPGLERALRMHYRDEDSSLKDLLQCGVEEKLIHDALFADKRPFTAPFSRRVKRLAAPKGGTWTEMLAHLIPALRNEYFHGVYLLAPDYLHLTFQLREIADALNTQNSRENRNAT